MKIRIRVHKGDSVLFEKISEVFDADSFGRSCAETFADMRSGELAHSTSVGAMMDMLDTSVLDILDGTSLEFSRA